MKTVEIVVTLDDCEQIGRLSCVISVTSRSDFDQTEHCSSQHVAPLCTVVAATLASILEKNFLKVR